MDKVLKIGTRDSRLAIWQAEQVKQHLAEQGITSELVLIKSEGDLDLVTPLYRMGVQGVFTRTLDAALLSKRIDIAVHSMKDVPTVPAEGLCIPAVLPRGNYKDVLVVKKGTCLSEPFPLQATIATSSIRRRAQWWSRYPEHQVENLRGNINTRLCKLEESEWLGAVFASAGLERLGLYENEKIELDWMLPAPAQGIICISCREDDVEVKNLCNTINHSQTFLCAKAERDFLQTLMGGCSTPIAALATIKNDRLYFRGRVVTPDGKESQDICLDAPVDEGDEIGKQAAHQLLKEDTNNIIERIRNAR